MVHEILLSLQEPRRSDKTVDSDAVFQAIYFTPLYLRNLVMD